MKFEARFFSSLLSKFIVNTCLLTISSASIYTFAAQDVKPERWFEIEVILFEQLGDKKGLKEQFSGDVNANDLPRYLRAFDLLTPYLQPDLTAIKQLIPLCNSVDGQSGFSLAQQKLDIPLPEQVNFINQANAFTYEPMALNLAENTEDDDIQPLVNDLQGSYSDNAENGATQPSQDEILARTSVSQANTKQVFDWQSESFKNPLFSTNQLCVYSSADFEQILDEQQLASFSLDSFDIKALPKRLKASGTHIKTHPYLISDDALRLKDISKRLRWSKEFKPLLHFGWRQIGVTRTKAIPLKLFAGQHVENDYQQALNKYQIEINKIQKQEQLLFEQGQNSDATPHINPEDTDDLLAAKEAMLNKKREQAEANYNVQVKRQALVQLLTDIDVLNENSAENTLVETTIDQLNQQSLDDLLKANEVISNTSERPITHAKPPIKPLQPWLLDGFFKVHLDHYLYITTDFNLLSKSVESGHKQDSPKDKGKLINFSQNRRVITGEIHYFDHPFIGMVVQIRRFDPTKPADEAVSQAIK